VEARRYAEWVADDLFSPDGKHAPDPGAPPYSIVIPPPVTFGGGITIEYGGAPGSGACLPSGENRSSATHSA